MQINDIAYYACSLLALIPAIVLHEVAHGFIAWRLGDPTARAAGRLSLNPIAHIDMFGTVVLPILMLIAGGPIFAYAKPVPYNPMHFKNKRVGDFLVGMAGPAANLVMALLGGAIAHLLAGQALQLAEGNVLFMYFYFLYLPLFVMVNLYLMFFNLLPVPPLDGSSIFALFIPDRFMGTYYKIERYAMPILLALVFIVPYVLHVNPISIYLNVTAGTLANLIIPF